jgi:hypothetical protein
MRRLAWALLGLGIAFYLVHRASYYDPNASIGGGGLFPYGLLPSREAP